MADVYVGGCYDDTEWYVKAFIDKGGVERRYGRCWDGAVHRTEDVMIKYCPACGSEMELSTARFAMNQSDGARLFRECLTTSAPDCGQIKFTARAIACAP